MQVNSDYNAQHLGLFWNAAPWADSIGCSVFFQALSLSALPSLYHCPLRMSSIGSRTRDRGVRGVR